MPDTVTINPRIVEALYREALVLSDEVRASFTLAGRLRPAEADGDLARAALSSEGLRTTTRMMHAIAWLLNHRAFFAGDISELQLRRHGRLAVDIPASDRDQLDLLDLQTGLLIVTTRRFYERLLRLDRAWRLGVYQPTRAIQRLHERIEGRLAS